MNKYIISLKELTNNFSYHQFINLLKEIDNEIINGNISSLKPEFIYYFNQIICMVNDNYIIDDKPGTLGHMLVENALLNKERLTPTLALCFLLEQKEKLGLDRICNTINFLHIKGNNYRMAVTNYHDRGEPDISINWSHYSKPKENTDEYNYDIMFDILHELTHVYQLTRTEQSENPFDKLAYYDFKKDGILIDNGGNTSNIFFHQALLSEFMADEQAHVFLIHLSQKHPEYFNPDLIQKKQIQYQNRKNGTYGNFGANPREAFLELISDIRKTYEENKNEESLAFIKTMLEEIEILDKRSQPLIEQLQMQGISEKGWDSYYSLYLKSLYQFDGEKIIFNNELQNKSSKGM